MQYREDFDNSYETESININDKPLIPEKNNSGKTSKHKKSNILKKLYLKQSFSLILIIVQMFIILFISYKLLSIQKEYEKDLLAKENMTEVISYSQEQVDNLVSEALEDGKKERETEILGTIKNETENKATSLWSLLRKLYPEKLVIQTNTGYQFLDPSPNIEKNNILKENIIQHENGELTYAENGSDISVKGIDVSSFQGEIDWEQVAQSGVKFAMVRVGYRGYGSGKLVEDETYKANIEGASANNIEVGAYYFSQAINEDEMNEEVQVLLDAVEPYKITGPLVIDIEKIEDNSARGNKLTRSERTALVQIFLTKVKEAGYTPMIYGNLYSLFVMLDIEKIGNENIWFAYYDTELYYPYQLDIWQYTDSLKIPGIEGKVDGNILFNN